jgi:Rrf2 family protein
MGAASRHCGASRVSATDIAAETRLALPTVQKLVSILTKAGLLRSIRGAGGGFKLARPAAAISLADVIEAVEGPIALTDCLKSSSCTCAIQPDCSVKPHMQIVNHAVRGALAAVPITSLTQ